LEDNQPELPALIAIISGGHSELVLMESHLQYKHIGATRDDAAGEAFDKVARLLGLPYPGGPAIDHLAREGNADAYKLPISLPEHGNLEFSFSGLKAAVAGLVGKLPNPIPRHIKADVAASFQKTVADTIAKKTVWALEKNPEVKSVCLVGGVAANEHLRVRLEQAVHMFNPEIKFFVPEFKYCTDNAAMIAAAACFHSLYGASTDWRKMIADPNLELGS
jgi:N6-L-threonylcarbamoyladenine synthase